ncbi:MAG: V-type ATP synthase subunit E [Clostridia bacterium]|nr:V-type ATP synthase subunit E [Clostridia bacterium]
MNGKSKIIERILSDADSKCAEISAAAQLRAEQTVAQADSKIAQEKQALTERLQNQAQDIVKNKLANAALDARKYKLECKQNLIASCYDKALERLVKSTDAEYKKIISDLLNKFAEDGESVCIADKDADVITQRFLDGVGKDLTLSDKRINATGGVVIEGNGYDKDLTFEALVSYAKADTEATVAELLFGEDK